MSSSGVVEGGCTEEWSAVNKLSSEAIKGCVGLLEPSGESSLGQQQKAPILIVLIRYQTISGR